MLPFPRDCKFCLAILSSFASLHLGHRAALTYSLHANFIAVTPEMPSGFTGNKESQV